MSTCTSPIRRGPSNITFRTSADIAGSGIPQSAQRIPTIVIMQDATADATRSVGENTCPSP